MNYDLAAGIAFFALGANVLGAFVLLLVNPRSRELRWYMPFQLAIITWLFALGMGIATRDWAAWQRLHFAAVHMLPGTGWTEGDVLRCAAAVERSSEHPIGAAVVAYARSHGIESPIASDVTARPGLGVEGLVEGFRVVVGQADHVLTSLFDRGTGRWRPALRSESPGLTGGTARVGPARPVG
jgi:hypothetical protein